MTYEPLNKKDLFVSKELTCVLELLGQPFLARLGPIKKSRVKIGRFDVKSKFYTL